MDAIMPSGLKENGRVGWFFKTLAMFAASCFAWRVANCAVGGLGLPSHAFGMQALSPRAHTFEHPMTRISGSVFRRPLSKGKPSAFTKGLVALPTVQMTVSVSM